MRRDSTHFYSRIADIGQESWTQLATGMGFYTSYPWLAWAERNPGFDATYVVVRDCEGQAISAAATYLWNGRTTPSMNLSYSPAHMVEESLGSKLSAAMQAKWLPCLLVGSRAGYHGALLVAPGETGARRSELVAALFSGIEKLARDLEASTIAFLYVPEKLASECHGVWTDVRDGLRAPLMAPQSVEAVLTPRGTGGITGSIGGASTRRRWNKEQARFQAHVERLEVARLSESIELITPLLGATQRKYGAPDSDGVIREWLLEQVPDLDPLSHVLLEYRGADVVGCSLSYIWEDGVYVRGAGFAENSAPFSFFNLGFYEPARLADSLSLPSVNVGAGGYLAKQMRGATPRYTSSLVVPPAESPAEWVDALQRPGWDYKDALAVWNRT